MFEMMMFQLSAVEASAAPVETGIMTSAVAVQSDGRTLDDIVVTAQKREQRLQDVPISVTVVDAATLRSNRIENVIDLSAAVPNLTARPVSGGLSLPSISLRGVLSLGAVPGADREVGLYLDGVYIGSPAGSVFDVADIQRIEVLRGPQGTLFGRNSTAGAINIITRDPDGQFGLHQEIGLGNFDQFRSRTRLNLPSLGPFSASATYVHSERRGDVRNLGAGTSWDYRGTPQTAFGLERSPRWLGDQNVEAVGVTIKFASGDLDASYKFDWTENHFSPEAVGVIGIHPRGAGPAGGALISGLLATQPPGAMLTPITNRRPDAVNNWFTTPSYVRHGGHNLTARYRLTDNLSIQNILAYRSSYAKSAYQIDGFGGLVSTIPPSASFPIPLGTPFLIYGSVAESRAHQWSNEFQLNYSRKALTLTAGYLHFKGKVIQGTPGGVPSGNAFKFYPNFVIPATSEQPSRSRTRSDALFAQAELEVVPRLAVVAGYRHTWDYKIGIAHYPGLPERSVYKKDEPAFAVGVNYKPDRDALLYAKYSAAFVSGGSFSGLAYDPEHARSWEVGAKAEWFDRRVTTNLALFTVTYRDLQQTSSGANLARSSGRPELAQLSALLVNAGSARARGAEFEGRAVPFDNMMLQAGVGYTKTRFLSVNPLFGTLATNGVTFRPKWTINLAAQYATDPVWGDARMRFRVDANYRSEYDVSVTDPTPALAAVAHSPAAWVVNGRIALADLSFVRSKAELAVWGRNIFNDKSITFASALPFIFSASYERARTYGVELSFDF